MASPSINHALRVRAPSDLQARPKDDLSGIELRWLDNSNDETGFTIARSGGGTAYFYPSANQISYTDTTAQPGVSYTYWVLARNGYGNSSWSNSANTTIVLPTVSIEADLPWSSEIGADPGQFVIARSGGSLAPRHEIEVSFALAGTAMRGVDYPDIAASVTIAPGQVATYLAIDPFDDAQEESSETVEASLAEGTLYAVGTPNTGTLIVLEPKLEIGIFDEDLPGVSADDPRAFIGAVVTLGRDAQDKLMFAADGTVIEWRVEGDGGSISSAQTTTYLGFSHNVLSTTTAAGDIFQVFARITTLQYGSYSIRWAGDEATCDPVAVYRGRTSTVTIESSPQWLASDQTATAVVTAIAWDSHGNLVMDGTEVIWGGEGLSELVSAETSTANGQAQGLLLASWTQESRDLSVEMGLQVESTDLLHLPIIVSLATSAESLELGSAQTATITATFVDSLDSPVPDGTPVIWFSQKGSIAGSETVLNGQASATVYADGGAQTAGTGFVAAMVCNNVAAIPIEFLAPQEELFLELERSVVVGDAATDGYVYVEQLSGDFTPYPYYTSTTGRVLNGPPFGTVRLTLGTPEAPNDGLLRLNGSLDPVDLVLDEAGEASFTIRSTGSMSAAGNVYMLPVCVEVLGESLRGVRMGMLASAGQPSAQANVAIKKKSFWGKAWDYSTRFVWGAFAGGGEGIVEVTGDIAISVIPVVGVYSDGRDIVKELARVWPGGEAPDWPTVGFAIVGVAAEFTGPGDWAVDVMKQLYKLIGAAARPLNGILADMLKRALKNWDFTELNAHRALFTRLSIDADFARLAAEALARTPDQLQKLRRVTDIIGVDESAALFKRIGVGPRGYEHAHLLLDALGGLTDAKLTVLKNGGKLDIVADAVVGANWRRWVTWDYAQLVEELGANNALILKFDEFASVQGSSKLISRLRSAGTRAGAEAELDVAMKYRTAGETVTELRANIADGDVDVVTNLKAIEVKSGSVSNEKLDKFVAQLTQLKAYASSTGKTPVLAVKQPLNEAYQKLVDSVGGISVVLY